MPSSTLHFLSTSTAPDWPLWSSGLDLHPRSSKFSAFALPSFFSPKVLATPQGFGGSEGEVNILPHMLVVGQSTSSSPSVSQGFILLQYVAIDISYHLILDLVYLRISPCLVLLNTTLCYVFSKFRSPVQTSLSNAAINRLSTEG